MKGGVCQDIIQSGHLKKKKMGVIGLFQGGRDQDVTCVATGFDTTPYSSLLPPPPPNPSPSGPEGKLLDLDIGLKRLGIYTSG